MYVTPAKRVETLAEVLKLSPSKEATEGAGTEVVQTEHA